MQYRPSDANLTDVSLIIGTLGRRALTIVIVSLCNIEVHSYLHYECEKQG